MDQQACAQTSVLPGLAGRQASVHGTVQGPCKISGYQGHKSPEDQWALFFAGSQGDLQGDQGILGNTKTVPAASGQQFIPGNHTATFLTCSTLFLGTLANPQEECRDGTSPQSMVSSTDQALCQELQYRSCQLQK